MNSTAKKYTVSVQNETYFLLSDETEEKILKISKLVNDSLEEISQKAPSLSSRQVAILALFNAYLEKNKLDDALKVYKQKESELLKVVEQTTGII